MKDDHIHTKEKREKNWKLLYLRSAKLARAKQLGMDYPRTTSKQQTELDENEPLNLLFVCSRNQWRSPTAEAVWRNYPGIRARSAGTSPNARKHVTIDDIRWAHSIFVMEEKHRSRLLAEFGRAIANKPIHVLDIPDEYQYMDPELVEELRVLVGSILGLP